LDNNKVVLPHMSKWNPEHPRWTGCHNSPEFREIFMKEADALIEAGVDAIHVDDWMITHQTGQHGLACFCPSCTKGFRSYLRETLAPEELVQMGIGDIASFDYAKHLVEREKVTSQIDYRRRFRKLPLTPHFLDFQRESLRSFYEEFRQHLNKASPEGYIPVSVNNQFYSRSRDKSYRGYFAVDVIDFFAGEASRVMQTAPHYIVPCKVAEAFGIPQIMMSKPGPIGASQAALATTYALGQWFRVPWDLYMDITPDGKAAPRYFGKTTDWQPYYDFIHQHPDLFNGYRSAASVGVLFNVDASPYEAVWSACQSLATRQTQFRLVAATGRYGHAGLRRESFEGLRTVIMVSSDETFTVEDRALLDSVKKERRTRFISLSEFERRDRTPMVPLLKLEAPEDIFAFIRVEPNKEPLSAVVHLVNWNLRVGGGNDPFKHLSLGLPFSDEWKGRITARYFQPGRKEVEGLELEWHSGYVRMTVPRLEVWGIVELAAKPGQLRKESLP
jgi:hypothetical protein